MEQWETTLKYVKKRIYWIEILYWNEENIVQSYVILNFIGLKSCYFIALKIACDKTRSGISAL